jgi:hypothetical protein
MSREVKFGQCVLVKEPWMGDSDSYWVGYYVRRSLTDHYEVTGGMGYFEDVKEHFVHALLPQDGRYRSINGPGLYFGGPGLYFGGPGLYFGKAVDTGSGRKCYFVRQLQNSAELTDGVGEFWSTPLECLGLGKRPGGHDWLQLAPEGWWRRPGVLLRPLKMGDCLWVDARRYYFSHWEGRQLRVVNHAGLAELMEAGRVELLGPLDPRHLPAQAAFGELVHPHLGSWWPERQGWFSHWEVIGKNECRAVVVDLDGVAADIEEPDPAVWQDGLALWAAGGGSNK